MSDILILGAGGHAKVIADILRARGVPVMGFLDDEPSLWGQTRLGIPILGAMSSFADHHPGGLVVGIGDNGTRQSLARRFDLADSGLLVNAIHPTATVSPNVTLGRGVVIAAGAIVNVGTAIGDLVVINTGASIDHDCVIDECAHLAPGTRLAGGVRVGAGSLVGIGAVAIPNVSIGSWAVIGAGAAVVDTIPDNCTAVGVPASVIKQREPGWQLGSRY